MKKRKTAGAKKSPNKKNKENPSESKPSKPKTPAQANLAPKNRAPPPQIEAAAKKLTEGAKEGAYSFLKSFLVFCAIFLVIGVIASFIFLSTAPKPSWQWGVEAPPLHNTANFSLIAGDFLEYEINSSEGAHKLRVDALNHPSCPGVLLADAQNSILIHGSLGAAMQNEPGVYAVCIGANGYEASPSGGPLGSPLGFANSTWPFYAPWMLALHKNFSMEANQTLTIFPGNHTARAPIKIRVMGEKTISGRDVFEVEVMRSGTLSPVFAHGGNEGNEGQHSILYIDKQLRILFFQQYEKSSIILLNSSFFEEYRGHP
ncbi:hypothetical protein COU37_05430 [Candidatus Micrarchaeota archaeon CG10_big_fil_rev_8_21_14_0_10_45_29]|nr:MAG: hypothetical protein COU37_05430 [Candidatus Micrarchaeota archaeon CG10_big_fil_rev_8_21_14_0_10_45_29]